MQHVCTSTWYWTCWCHLIVGNFFWEPLFVLWPIDPIDNQLQATVIASCLFLLASPLASYCQQPQCNWFFCAVSRSTASFFSLLCPFLCSFLWFGLFVLATRARFPFVFLAFGLPIDWMIDLAASARFPFVFFLLACRLAKQSIWLLV